MSVLVTGGAGFIGSHYCEYLLANYPNIRVVCLDKLTYAGNKNNLKSVLKNPNFTFIKGDICNKKLVENCINNQKISTIINFAAESHVDRSINSNQEFLKTNVIGTGVLLDLAVKYNLRFHQVSTDEVYGDLPIESELSFTEQSRLNPSSGYSASKASADLLVLAYCRTHGLRGSISRSANNFGTRQHSEKFIPTVITCALKNSAIPIYGNGLNVRDWIEVKENCRAIDLIVQNGKIGEIYNIGANNELSNIALAKQILDILQKPHSLLTFVLDRKGHDLKYSLSTKKIKNELGFNANNNFKKDLTNTVLWYKKQLEK